MELAADGEGWQLVAMDLGVDNGAMDRRVQEVLHSQDLGGDILGCSIWKSTRLLPGWEKDAIQELGWSSIIELIAMEQIHAAYKGMMWALWVLIGSLKPVYFLATNQSLSTDTVVYHLVVTVSHHPHPRPWMWPSAGEHCTHSRPGTLPSILPQPLYAIYILKYNYKNIRDDVLFLLLLMRFQITTLVKCMLCIRCSLGAKMTI